MPYPNARYVAYLLRLWQERAAGQVLWRASLEESHTGQRHGFADLEQLFVFLKEKTENEEDEASNQEE